MGQHLDPSWRHSLGLVGDGRRYTGEDECVQKGPLTQLLRLTTVLISPFQSLFSPLVNRLGFEPSKEDTHDMRQLRTLAIREAAAAKDEE
jgi:hypothetical protein